MPAQDSTQHQMLLEAIEHHKSGRFQQAENGYRRLLQINPQFGEAWANLAIALAQMNRANDAIRAMERALVLMPQRFDLHDLLGTWYLQAGDPYQAVASHRRAIAVNPNSAPSHANLGLALAKKTGGMDEAIAACRRAVELAPGEVEAYRTLGVVLEQAKDYAAAADIFAAAIAIAPAHAECFGRMGTCLEALNRLDDAIAHLRQGIERCPNESRLHANLSCVLRKQNRYQEALAAADRAITLAPASGEAHGHRSLALFALGDYEKGFYEYEWRWRCDNFTTEPRDFGRPMWDGSDPKGRSILVHAEQGLGDSLQFARFLPMLADRGATVIFECHHSLRKLMSRVRGVSRAVSAGTALPASDLHAPLLSLPSAFHVTHETLPRAVPYLHAEPARVEVWSARIKSAAPDRFRVGLIWAGNVKPDANRTVPADALRPLAGVAKVQFFGLQKRNAETFQPAPAELNLIDLAEDFTDFDETAAAMSALDLIISIDTGPAHLAGALGRPTLLMIPWAPDWRWLAEDENGISHWYPTIRIFRQTVDRQWGDVVARARDALEKLAR